MSNWSGFAFQVLIAFLLTPFIINALGNTYYGIWALVVSLTGYYGLLDMGFGAGLTQYVARHYANRDFVRLNQTMSTGFVALGACAAVLLVVSIGLAFLAHRLFEIPPEATREVQLAILIVGSGAALQFLFLPYSSIFPATQRFDVSNAIGIGTRLLFAILVYLALHYGYGLVGVSAATMASNLVDYSLRLAISYRLIPQLKVSPRLANMASVRDLVQFGAWNMIIAGSVRLIAYTDAVVIAVFLPPAAITPFVLASNLNDYFMRIFVPIGYVFFPVFTEHDARGNNAAMRELFLNGTRLLALLAPPLALLAYWFSEDFFSLWIGQAVAKGEYPSAATLFSILIIASAVSSVQRIAYQLLLGARQVKTLALCFIIEGAANLVLSVLLVRPFGLLGVAFGTLVPAVVIQGILLPILICRLYSIRFVDYLFRVFARPALITLALLPLLWIARSLISPTTWIGLAVDGAAALVMIALLILMMGISGEERQRFLWRPITSFRKKLLA